MALLKMAGVSHFVAVALLLLGVLSCTPPASASNPFKLFSWGPSQASCASHAGRMLKVIAYSDTQKGEHETQGYNKDTNANVAGPFATRDLPPFSALLAKTVTGLTPEQLSVTYWAPGAYLISWVSSSTAGCVLFLLDALWPPGFLCCTLCINDPCNVMSVQQLCNTLLFTEKPACTAARA